MKLEAAFARTRREGRRALMPFLMAGFPNMAEFRKQLNVAAEFADVIEVGVPFSDPIADGPVIQEAAAEALRSGTTLGAVLDELARFKGPPVVLMISINQILSRGQKRLVEKCAESGVAGLIVPDLPFEESRELRELCASHGLHLIAMVAPTTVTSRLEAILKTATGFIYLIAISGVTGERSGVSADTVDYISRVRKSLPPDPVPLCVGFGISGPDQIATLREYADGFIVGSALVRRIAAGDSIEGPLKDLRDATRNLEGAK